MQKPEKTGGQVCLEALGQHILHIVTDGCVGGRILSDLKSRFQPSFVVFSL